MSRLRVRRRLLAVGLTVSLATPITLVATESATSAAESTTFNVLKRGDDGRRVLIAQRALDVKPRTGHFNRETRSSVRHFQHRRHFSVTGIINERTMHALRSRWDNIQQRKQRIHREYRRIMQVVRNQHGDPYVYGAAGPNAFDCSGLTLFVYKKATSMNLDHRATAQFDRGERISRNKAKPGDLVFMHNNGDIYHVSIYAGKGQIWHASRPGTNVKKDPIWTKSVYFARLLPHP